MSSLADPDRRSQNGQAPLGVREALISGLPLDSLRTAGEIGSLALRTVSLMVRPPFSWVRDAILETNALVRRCWVPLAVSMFAWTVGYAFILLTGFVRLLGAEDRMPGALVLGFTREPIVWVTGMVFAGATGAAITADLAARKNREELDALAVLGVDRIRLLVVPRVVAAVIACVVLGMLAILVTIATDVALAPYYSSLSRGLVFKGIVQSMLSTDQIAAVLKFVLIGFFVGVVSCAKGLSAKGGTEGVGRSVNQTVVLTFAGIWVINSVFNLAYLTIFPQLADFKG
jgi:phospholipid/cholesterol/gamma-HCH transport system permease protein